MEKKALEFAKIKHEGQMRKNIVPTPYITHPINVAEYVKHYLGENTLLVSCAYLHDTLEDTNTTYHELVGEFGPEVASIVLELTNSRAMVKNLGKERYLSIKMKAMSDNALTIKLCDRLDNISSLTDVEDNFKTKYISETTNILNNLVKERELSEIQITIIKDIFKQIKYILNNSNHKIVRKKNAS